MSFADMVQSNKNPNENSLGARIFAAALIIQTVSGSVGTAVAGTRELGDMLNHREHGSHTAHLIQEETRKQITHENTELTKDGVIALKEGGEEGFSAWVEDTFSGSMDNDAINTLLSSIKSVTEILGDFAEKGGGKNTPIRVKNAKGARQEMDVAVQQADNAISAGIVG
jgi:hypothetical protein